MRGLWVTAVLAGWLWLLLGAAPVNAAGVALEASAGFDNLARQGAWLPVRVTLTNDGADTHVVVRVQRRGGDGGLVSVSQPVELPTGARKQVTLLLLAEGVLGPLAVQALSGDQPVAETQIQVTIVPSGADLVGIVASSPEAAGRVVAGLGMGGGANSTARLTPDDLPTNPYALAALDMLIINGASTRALTPDQVAALGEWVALGGTLVLGGGSAAPAVLEGLTDLAPVRLSGPAVSVPRLPGLETLTSTPVEAPGPFVVATAAPLPGAAVLAAQDSTPLVVSRPVGQGRAAFVALDLGLDPFLGWTGASAFWANLRQGDDQPLPLTSLTDTGMRLHWALGSGTALDLPATGTLALLLLAYVVVIGPVNYLVLRRLDRREWAWLTTPAITLLFTGGLFAVGAGARGGQVVVNSINIISSAAGVPAASVESFIGVFSPGRATHTLTLPSGALVSGLPGIDRGPNAALPALQVWQGHATEVRDVPFAAADFKTFVAQGNAGPAPVTTELRLEGDRVVGMVRNTGSEPLVDAALVVGEQIHQLGTLAPGASAAVDWRPTAAPGGDLPLAARLNGGRFPDAGSGRDWRQQARFQVLSLLFESDLAATPPSGVLVLGWQEASPLELTVTDQVVRQQAVTLVRHHAALTVRPGQVTVPPGLLARSVDFSDARMSRRFGAGLLTLAPGESLVSFALPHELSGLVVDELELVIGHQSMPDGVALPSAARPGTPAALRAANPTPLPAGANVRPVPEAPRPLQAAGSVRFALYDYTRRTWVDLPHAGAGRVLVPDAAAFVSPAGPVRLRVVVAAGQPLALNELALGLRGRLP